MISMSVETEKKEDFLEVDKPIPGQNFVCLSFVSPEKVLASKERFKSHQFLTSFLKEKFSMTTEQWTEEYENYISQNDKRLEEEFLEQNKFQTTVRGVKVRGVFDTYREAEVRSKVLQRMDRSFHVFVGQVGYWLPWDPDANEIENQEYLENELNNLVHKYKENEHQRDNYYSQQVRDRKQKAIEENEKKRAEQKQNQQLRREKQKKLAEMNRRGKEESGVEETSESVEGDGEGNSELDGSGEGVSQVMDNLSGGESHEERKKMYNTTE